MKQVTYGSKSILLSDDAADMLLEFAAGLANAGRADTVELRVLGINGDEMTVMLLLNAGTSLVSEAVTTTAVALPENSDAMDYMRERVELSSAPPQAQPVETFPWDDFENLDSYN